MKASVPSMTLSELRLAVGNVTNPRSSTPPLNVIAFSKVAQFVSDENPCVNQKRDVRVTTWELATLANDTFRALSTAAGNPIEAVLNALNVSLASVAGSQGVTRASRFLVAHGFSSGTNCA